MAASSSPSVYPQQPHFIVPQQAASRTVQKQLHSSKSFCSSILLKSLIVMLVLVVIPIFPSQAPDFITQSVVTQFWELFHLMFIGIAVCYGLFCKRSSIKTYDETPHSRFDSSDVNVSGISNVASIFDDGLENFCGSDEKRVIPNWDSQFLHYECKVQERFELDEGEKMRSFSNENGAGNFCGVDDRRVIPNWDSQFLQYDYRGQERSNLDEGEKSRSFIDVNGVENTGELNEREVTQVWNSQYFVGESMVVVTNGNYGVEKLDHIDHKPLGLPVRSLRYRAVHAEKTESVHGNTANSGGSSSSTGYEVKGDTIRGMAPANLRRKFEEASGPRQTSWRSRSQGRELGGVNTVKLPSHSRPHSVGQLEFGHLKSRSSRKPVSSRTSPTSSPPSITSPSSSCSSENGSLKIPHSDPDYVFKSVFISTSQQTGASTGEAAVLTSKIKLSSNESCPEVNVQLRDEYEEDAKNMKMNPSSKEAHTDQGHPHSRVPSAGDTEFGDLEPWSFWNGKPSLILSNSSSPRAISPISSASPEIPNSRKQDPERPSDVKPPSVQGSQRTARAMNDAAAFVASKTRRSTGDSSSRLDMHCTSKDTLKKVEPVNGEAAFHTSRSQAFSVGSSSEITMQESSNDKVKLISKDFKEDSLYIQKLSVNSSVSDMKPPTPLKNSSRGKSVRTVRTRRNFTGRSKRKEDDCPKERGDTNEVSCDQFDAILSMKCVKGEGHPNLLVNSTKDVPGIAVSITSSAFSESKPEANQHFVNMNIVESKENSESKGNSDSVLTNPHMSSDDEEAGSNLIDDVDLGSEVDRKAGEFIAKFREQIRLQKIESFRRTSG